MAPIGQLNAQIPAMTDYGRVAPQKVFARPFRLVFDKPTGEITSIEVKTLDGLREVIRRRDEGKVVERNGFSLELQLWGVLAEHLGFMAVKSSDTSFGYGVQPLGEEAAALVGDMSALFGNEEAAVTALTEMRKNLKTEREAVEPTTEREATHLYVKPDGVNLTPEGEAKLGELVAQSPPTPLLLDGTREQGTADCSEVETPTAEDSGAAAEDPASDSD